LLMTGGTVRLSDPELAGVIEKIVEDAITDDAREAERVTDGVIDDGGSDTRLGD